MLHPQIGAKLEEGALQKVQIPHKIGMLYSIKRLLLSGSGPYDQIWKEKMLPFPVTKLGGEEKRKWGGGGFLAGCMHSKMKLSHSLHSDHRLGSVSQTAWLMVMSDLPWHLGAGHERAHLHDSRVVKGESSLNLFPSWHFIFKTHTKSPHLALTRAP